jgi:hypothetical protein
LGPGGWHSLRGEHTKRDRLSSRHPLGGLPGRAGDFYHQSAESPGRNLLHLLRRSLKRNLQRTAIEGQAPQRPPPRNRTAEDHNTESLRTADNPNPGICQEVRSRTGPHTQSGTGRQRRHGRQHSRNHSDRLVGLEQTSGIGDGSSNADHTT